MAVETEQTHTRTQVRKPVEELAPPAFEQKTEDRGNARPIVPGGNGSNAAERADAAGNYGNMQDVINFLEEKRAAIHIPTKEELEKERRRQKAERIISAAADGARAISNLIATTQYAPDMYRQEGSMSARTKERYDKLKQEREADADRYYNYSMAIKKLMDDNDDKDYQRGRDALRDHLAELKARNAAKLSEIRYKRISQQISDAEAAAEEREANADLDRQIREARLEVLKSQRDRNNRGGRGSGGGRPAEYAWRDKDGNLHYCHSEGAARSQAAANDGTYVTTPTRRSQWREDGHGYETTTETETDVSTPQETVEVEWED